MGLVSAGSCYQIHNTSNTKLAMLWALNEIMYCDKYVTYTQKIWSHQSVCLCFISIVDQQVLVLKVKNMWG